MNNTGKILGYLAIIGIGVFVYSQYRRAKKEQKQVTIKQ